MRQHTGRHFLQIPGPTNVPDQVLSAMARPTIDHRGPEFAALTQDVLARLAPVFGTEGPVVIFPSSGTGAWEAALVNTLSPGDRVLAFETGHFATLWQRMATALDLTVGFVPGDWRHGVDPDVVRAKLTDDVAHEIRAVCVVHNETSTGVVSPVADVRRAIDAAGHPALLLADTVSSLGSMDYRHDEWGVDVTVAASQKGLMLPPGLGFNAVSEKALFAARTAALPRSYWNWQAVIDANTGGSFPYTPSTNLMYGLAAALDLLHAEGLPAVFARHDLLAEATRAAVRGWGLDVLCAEERAYSSSVTAVLLGDGQDADAVRDVALRRYDMSLGVGLGRFAGRVFRIGHLGHLNELTLIGALGGVQLGLQAAGVPVKADGITAAMEVLGRT
ncbi:MAG TPA: aminotransferase class V-fold PLP-dependent enzyme [Pseudonocardiaceae bacterium]|nr:aminotransferase class V-fold PLP-dependent enzyme [Pseudonocardiaceae bacterium]